MQAGALAPDDALRFVEVTPLGIRKVRQFHVRGQIRDEVCANLGDQSIAHDAPFSTTGHDLPSCFQRIPEATPLANDAITLPDDFINTPEWPPCDLEFTPIPCQMLCPMYGWKAWRQTVVHNAGVAGAGAGEVEYPDLVRAAQRADAESHNRRMGDAARCRGDR